MACDGPWGFLALTAHPIPPQQPSVTATTAITVAKVHLASEWHMADIEWSWWPAEMGMSMRSIIGRLLWGGCWLLGRRRDGRV